MLKLENEGSKSVFTSRSARLIGRRSWTTPAILYPLSSILLFTGCQQVLPPKVTPVTLMEDQNPHVVDASTTHREFDRSTSYYPSGAVESPSTRFPFGPREGARSGEAELLAVPLFLGNVVALPFTYLFKPPFSTHVYHGDYTNPTHTALPAYPVEAAATSDDTQSGLTQQESVAPSDALVPPTNAPAPAIVEPDNSVDPEAVAPETVAPETGTPEAIEPQVVPDAPPVEQGDERM